MTETVELKLTDKQFDLLSRIAAEDKRRLGDLFYLLFGEGLKYFYMETGLSIEKKPNEYSKEDKHQLAKNKHLEATDGWNSLDYTERQAKGYKHICSYMGTFDEGETFIDKLSKDITNNAFKEEL